MLAWKKRTGLGGSIVVSQKWERRWIVVSGNKMVYYSLGKEDAPTPRGVIDLQRQEATIHVPARNASDAPTLHELDLVAKDEQHGGGGGGGGDIVWKLCFDTQQDQLFMLETVHNVIYQHGFDEKDFDRFEHDLESGDHVFRWEMIVCPPVIYPIQIHGIVLEAGRNCVIIADFGLTGYGKQEGADFNHAEDHNASIMAAWKKLRPKEDQRLNIVTCLDPKEIRKWKRANYESSFVQHHVGANKLGKSLTKFFKSTTNKTHKSSISDSIATDATVAEEERERTTSEDSASVGGRLSKFFSKNAVIKKQDSAVTDATVAHANSNSETKDVRGSDLKEGISRGVVEEATNVAAVGKDEDTGDKVKDTLTGEAKEMNENNGHVTDNEEAPNKEACDENRNAYMKQSSGLESVSLEEEEEPSQVPQMSEQRLESNVDDEKLSKTPLEPKTDDEIQEPDETGDTVETEKRAHEKLPKSDPKKIVLARAHFLLENGEEMLPPYHVFFSNSECIAVWCKTGRWSTLQTAVYLTGHSVGAAKSSTMATIGVAAAHAVFAPVVAVGGLIWVSAPMVILQKSRKKWDEATMKLTPLFWEWAPPEVFVAAIENWSDIR
jgi:hypothetical protein